MENKAEKVMRKKTAFKVEMDKRLTKEQSDSAWENACRLLNDFYRKYEDISEGEKNHTTGFIFPAAAIYLSLKKIDADIAFSIMRNVMKARSEKMGKGLAKALKISGLKTLFIKMWDVVSHKMFGPACGFRNVFYPNEKGSFRMDITQCPYNKYLTELGCPEITKLFCDNDVYMYSNLPGVRFTRTKTLGYGNELCDFKMETERKS